MAQSGKARQHRGRGAAPVAGPARTCCGCREIDARDALIRVVEGPDGEAVIDLRGKLPGRGAWVHARAACLEAVERKPASLSRSLHAAPDTAGLIARLRELVVAAALDGLSMAAAAGALVSGRDLLTAALRDGRLIALVVASDASDRTVDEYRGGAVTVPVVVLPVDTVALGARVGKGPRAVLGVRSATASAHLVRQLHRLVDLG